MKVTEMFPIVSILRAKFSLPGTKDLKVKLGLVVVRKIFCLVDNLLTAVRDKNQNFGFLIPKVQFFCDCFLNFDHLKSHVVHAVLGCISNNKHFWRVSFH